MLSAFLGGLAMGYLAVKYQSILPAIAIHALWNGISSVAIMNNIHVMRSEVVGFLNEFRTEIEKISDRKIGAQNLLEIK